MKEKRCKEQLHLARGVLNLHKHPFSPVFLHHSPRYLTQQSRLYLHLVPVSLSIQSCMKKININTKCFPYNHKVLYMVKHALFVAIEALPHYHRKIRKTGYDAWEMSSTCGRDSSGKVQGDRVGRSTLTATAWICISLRFTLLCLYTLKRSHYIHKTTLALVLAWLLYFDLDCRRLLAAALPEVFSRES